MTRLKQALLASAILGALAVPAHAAQRAYVASYGSDANTATGCLLANPCRGFTAAHSVVDAGGEIVALDAAGYGALTITKSVTITTNPGTFAGIAASSGNGITIATAGVNVTLRGLNINGIGAANGISMTVGDSLNLENCVLSNFAGFGATVSGGARVRILNVLARNNGLAGIVLGSGVTAAVVSSQFLDNQLGLYAANATSVAIRDAVMSGGVYGLAVDGAAVVSVIQSTAASNLTAGMELHDTSSVYLGYSQVSHNGTGLVNGGTGILGSMGNNAVVLNGTNTSGTITPVGGI